MNKPLLRPLLLRLVNMVMETRRQNHHIQFHYGTWDVSPRTCYIRTCVCKLLRFSIVSCRKALNRETWKPQAIYNLQVVYNLNESIKICWYLMAHYKFVVDLARVINNLMVDKKGIEPYYILKSNTSR